MDSISSRTWSLIGFIGLLVFCSYWLRFSAKHPNWNPLTMGFSYQMARSGVFEPGFDLSDRSVGRDYKTMKVEAAIEAKKKANDAKVDPKQAQKDADAKKRLQAQNAAKAAANAAARKAMAHTGQLGVDVVDTSMDMSIGEFENALAPSAGSFGGGATAVAKAATPPAAGEDKKKEEDTVLSATQWRSLLQSAPTAENISKFVQAKQSGKLDSTSYYQIVHELLTDSAEDRRTAALSALDQDVSAETYIFMASEMSGVSGDQQTQLKSRLDMYATASRLGILMQVFTASQNPAVLQSATAHLTTALAAYKQSQNAGQGSGGPLGGSGFTTQQFTAFLPTLQALAQNSASSVSEQASALATEIQNLTQTTS